jgi:hypothetical protein
VCAASYQTPSGPAGHSDPHRSEASVRHRPAVTCDGVKVKYLLLINTFAVIQKVINSFFIEAFEKTSYFIEFVNPHCLVSKLRVSVIHNLC